MREPPQKRQQRAGIVLLLHEGADGRCLPVIPCASARRRQNRSDMFGGRRKLADADVSGFLCSVHDTKKGCQTHLSLTALKHFRPDRGMIHANPISRYASSEHKRTNGDFRLHFWIFSGEIQLFCAGSRVVRRISARAADRNPYGNCRTQHADCPLLPDRMRCSGVTPAFRRR